MATKVQPNIHQNDCSEEPPPYFSCITQPGIQPAPTTTDVNPYSTQPNSKVKLPLYDYTASMAPNTIPQSSTTTSSVTVVSSQPRFNYGRPSSFTQSASGTAEQLFGASVLLAIFCTIFGSPLTLICIVPAIYLSQKVPYCYMTPPIYLTIHAMLLVMTGEILW